MPIIIWNYLLFFSLELADDYLLNTLITVMVHMVLKVALEINNV